MNGEVFLTEIFKHERLKQLFLFGGDSETRLFLLGFQGLVRHGLEALVGVRSPFFTGLHWALNLLRELAHGSTLFHSERSLLKRLI